VGGEEGLAVECKKGGKECFCPIALHERRKKHANVGAKRSLMVS